MIEPLGSLGIQPNLHPASVLSGWQDISSFIIYLCLRISKERPPTFGITIEPVHPIQRTSLITLYYSDNVAPRCSNTLPQECANIVQRIQVEEHLGQLTADERQAHH
ncbi:1788_t:CDS:2 [Acaulospora colombiana]|uniref:1788_t:CDS:1 n=1 Tax=Acaulospora colombiana TaxID=27376 RepID=A0ACA9P6B4_9GLOM|nr:1788_t:CDS:2 [Acaulospora colombiana]